MLEIWKDIPEFEGLYQASDMGKIKGLARRVYSGNGKTRIQKELILKQIPHDGGYLKVSLRKDGKYHNRYVHRLVAETFIKNINDLPLINHKNEIKTDNRKENLEWVNYEENNTYNDKHLKIAVKRQKPVLQLTLTGELVKEWDSATIAASDGNFNQGHIWSVCNGRAKSHKGFIWEYA